MGFYAVLVPVHCLFQVKKTLERRGATRGTPGGAEKEQLESVYHATTYRVF